ncbi:MAG: methionyl-tRNA formyltransferase [Actinomycetota bacterium]
MAALPTGRPQRIVYLGTPEIAVAPLEVLVAAGFDVVLVVTRTDKRRGRGTELSPNPVKEAATRLGLEVSHDVEDVLRVNADLGVVVAFGQIIKPHILEQLAMINLHFSLLPRWRGAAPTERAILAGDEVTGVCLMQVAVDLDAGPLLDMVEVSVASIDTADALRQRLVTVGCERLVVALEHGLPEPQPQVGEVTYAAKLSIDEFRVNWRESARVIDRMVRVGLAWTMFRGRRLKIVECELGVEIGGPGDFLSGNVIACGNGSITLIRVQPEGKPVMDAAAWANGARPNTSDNLLDSPT